MKKLLLLSSLLLSTLFNSYARIEEGSFEFEGITRYYKVFLPQNFQPNLPVVFNWCGHDGADWMIGYTRMHDVTDTAGFVLVYPYSAGVIFNANAKIPGKPEPNVNDLGFISALIDTIKSQYEVDMSRIYCCGLNFGGQVTTEVILQIGYRFAAGARVNSSLAYNIAARSHLVRPFPIVLFNGTADHELPWPDARPGLMGGEEAISWWIGQNNCVLNADTVSLPDIDTNDSCTVDKISYTDCSGNVSVIFYKVINGGISWPGAYGDEIFDQPRNKDINASIEILNFFKNYQNPLANLAFCNNVNLSSIEDSLRLFAQLYNPEDHSTNVLAYVEAENSDYKDSLELQISNDSLANSYQGEKLLLDLNKDFYKVSIRTTDLDENISIISPFYGHFTNIDPLIIDSVSYTKGLFDSYLIKTFVRNDEDSITIKNAEIKFHCNDPWVSSLTGGNSLPDIAPGETVSSNSFTTINYIDSLLPTPAYFNLRAEITVNGNLYWTDSVRIDIKTQTEVKGEVSTPLNFSLSQNYPNPFNPSTKIRYQIPERSIVTLKIFDVLGTEITTLVNGEKSTGTYEVQFDATNLPSGVYFYRIQAGSFNQVRKMLLIK